MTRPTGGVAAATLSVAVLLQIAHGLSSSNQAGHHDEVGSSSKAGVVAVANVVWRSQLVLCGIWGIPRSSIVQGIVMVTGKTLMLGEGGGKWILGKERCRGICVAASNSPGDKSLVKVARRTFSAFSALDSRFW